MSSGLTWLRGREKVFSKLHETVADMMVEVVGKRDRVAVLDVGCGAGHPYKEFKKKLPPHVQVVYEGVDRDEAVCRYARELGIDVYCMPVEVFLSSDCGKRYDIIVLSSVLEDLLLEGREKTVRILRGLASRLAPCGTLIATMSNSRNWCVRYTMKRGWRRTPAITKAEFVQLLSDAGLQVRELRGVCYAMPLSLKKGYKFVFLPQWLCRLINTFDGLHEDKCIFMIARCSR
jgi:trans-aconitate methyltransferase